MVKSDECANYFSTSKRYSPNRLLVYLCIAFICINLAVILVDWLVFDPIVQHVTLFYGTFIGWYGIMDIWDDTISRVVEVSGVGFMNW